MRIERASPCKVNLLLNILGRRADGFHELETLLQPAPLHDELGFERGGSQVVLTCSSPELAADHSNLVHRAATAFLAAAGIRDGVRIHLEKNLPLAAGLGGGSGNAATTLLGMNELFGQPLPAPRLAEIAAALGSDVPFFLQTGPALGTGRGEIITPLAPFPALRGTRLLLVHPGFGVPTAWAYQALRNFPDALNGRPGRAQELVALLQHTDLSAAATGFYNSLEAPVLHKYPLLAIYQDFFRSQGALVSLMSGSGSSTFAIFAGAADVEKVQAEFRARFGPSAWLAGVAF